MDLLGISRYSCYYEAKGENPINFELMRLIDEQFSRNTLVWLSSDGPLATAGGSSRGQKAGGAAHA